MFVSKLKPSYAPQSESARSNCSACNTACCGIGRIICRLMLCAKLVDHLHYLTVTAVAKQLPPFKVLLEAFFSSVSVVVAMVLRAISCMKEGLFKSLLSSTR
eukprot:5720745-Amphidinium_carterae.1